ncbi:MAG: outer membrane protein assembly factor BamE [Gammaproteobacteria bacterium]
MPRLISFVFAAAFGLGVLGGCAYKTEVRQGAPLPEESIQQLRAGMTKQEVIALLGAPQSEHLFRDNIWLYYHKKRPAGFSPATSVVSVEITFDANERVGEFKVLIDDRPADRPPEEE